MKLPKGFIVITLPLIISPSTILASSLEDSSAHISYKPAKKNTKLAEAVDQNFPKNNLKNVPEIPKNVEPVGDIDSAKDKKSADSSTEETDDKSSKSEDLKHLLAAERLLPNDYSIKLKVGNIYQDLGENSKAFSQYNKASSSRSRKIQAKAKKAMSQISNLDIFYDFQKTDPKLARLDLQLFINKNPKNLTAQKEMGYFLVDQEKEKEALPYFLTAEKLAPKDYTIKAQLGYIYQDTDQPGKAYLKFREVLFSSDRKTRNEARKAMDSLIDMDTYYSLKETHPALAKNVLNKFLQREPKNLEAREEMGYVLIAEKKNEEALNHFLIAEQLAPKNYEIKSQLGNIYQDLGQNKKAFYKFKEASASPDHQLSVQSKRDMVSLAGTQTKILPDPWFADIYFSPYYLPRFDDFITYSQFRIGRNILPDERLQVYGTIYHSQDSQSGAGALPSIYADNYVAGDVGFRFYPLKKIPLYAYLEVGQAYNIIPDPYFRETSTQYDLRGGFDYFQDWGAPPDYFDKLTFAIKHEGSFFGDFSYYSRFHDAIGQVTLREGFRFLQYKYSSIGAYWKINGYFDTEQYFFNNAIETGPGLDIVPYNLIGVHLRLELTRGYYFPVNSPQPNPYGSIYNSSYAMVEGYINF